MGKVITRVRKPQSHSAGVSETILSTFERLFGKPAKLHEPFFGGNEWRYVKECLDTGWISSVGPFVDRFEKDLIQYTGVRSAVAVMNGTAALHLSLKMVDVRNQDEVILPTLTFIATANAIAYCDAVPNFVDSEIRTLGVDVLKLEKWLKKNAQVKHGECFNKSTGRRIKALIAVHIFGHPVDLDPLRQVCEGFRIELIEDAAEAIGSFYKGKHVGHSGRLTILSFNGNKTITTGGGGAILTNDEKMGKAIKHLTTTAKVPHAWRFDHDAVGYNYRMPNINAAVGCAQLEELPVFLEKKRKLAMRYKEAFLNQRGFQFFDEPEFAKSNFWLNTLLLNEDKAAERERLLEATNGRGYMTRPAWTLMHKLPMYEKCPRMDVSTAESLESRLINIPSSVFL